MGFGTRSEHSLIGIFAADVDIRVRVRGGGHTSQVYAIRQAIAKSIVCPSLQLPTIHGMPGWVH